MAITPVYDLITFGDIQNYIFTMVKGNPDDQETLNKVRSAINVYQRKICAKKRWTFLQETDRSFTLPQAINQGTISLTQFSNKVIGTGTAFTSEMVNWFIQPTNQPTNQRIKSVNVATQTIWLDSAWVGQTTPTSSFWLYIGQYPLWPNTDDILNVRLDGKPWKIKPIGPRRLSSLKQRQPTRQGPPRLYTIEGFTNFYGGILGNFILGYDFLGITKTKCVSFWPSIPDKYYTIHLDYKRIIQPLVNIQDIPVIPVEHRIMLALYGMAIWYLSNKDTDSATQHFNMATDEFNSMAAIYVDTNDSMELKPTGVGGRQSSDWLSHHSSQYFDTED